MNEKIIAILDVFEDLLDSKGIEIPCEDEREQDERHDGGNDAKIYGTEYGELYDAIEKILEDGKTPSKITTEMANHIANEFMECRNPCHWDGKRIPEPFSFDTHVWEYPLTEAVHLEITFGEDKDGWRCYCDLVDSASDDSLYVLSCNKIDSVLHIEEMIKRLFKHYLWI